MACVKAQVFKSGKTEASMKAFGRMTRPMGTVGLFILTVIATVENGSMIKLMVEELMNTWTAQNT